MKRSAVIIFLFFLNGIIFCQGYSVSGTVIDSLEGEPLFKANAIISDTSGSMIDGSFTNTKGIFKVDKLQKGSYRLSIEFLGFKPFKRNIVIDKNSVDLKTIRLIPTSIQTEEINIVDKPIPVVIKKDTTEFNANAFKVNIDANAEDLVKKMPGISVEDGQVKAQGEDVKKVLVDGKTFFGDDPNAVLKNVPAEIIERIQVFDKQSEQSEFSGFDDGNTSKTINIVTSLRIREGTFGKFIGGYGNEDKYLSSGNINVFNNEQRFSLLGQLNNINQQNFSNEDLLGVMSGSGGGGRRGGFQRPSGMSQMRSGGGSGGGSFQRGGGDVSNFLVSSKDGLTNTGAFGLNYTDNWSENFEISSSYFFNRTNNNSNVNTNRDYILVPPLRQNYMESNLSNTINTNHRLNIKLDYKIDSMNSVMLRPNLSVQQNDGTSNILGNTFSSGQNINSIINSFNSNLKAVDASAELLYRHRFAAKGRTVSVGINSSLKKNDGNNKLYSENYYSDASVLSDTVDQAAYLVKNGFSGSANLVYTEPVSDFSQLQFISAYYYSKDKSDLNTFKKQNGTGYSLLDTSLSNIYNKIYNTQTYGTGFRYNRNGWNFNLNLNYRIAQLKNEQTFPYSDNTVRKFYSILPSFMLRYGVSRDQNVRLFYRSNNTEPSVEQLQNVLDNSNPAQLRIGNPGLKQNYSQSLNINYSRVNVQDMTSFFVLLGGALTYDYVGTSTIIASGDTLRVNNIILNPGTQLQTYTNLGGQRSLYSFINYGMPVSFIKSNLNLSLNYNYARTPGIINSITNYSNSNSFGVGFNISSNISQDIDFSVSTNGNYSIVKNSSQSSSNNNYFSNRSRLKIYWNVWLGIILQTDFEYRYDGGLSGDYDPNSYLWNAGISKKLFNKDQGEIKIAVYDILKRNSNLQRKITDLYIEDTSTNVLTQYIMVSFIYNLRAF
ncbi:MAG: TonB-dependent receptor [Ignavibacteriales bacterium]|nr:MAG: TonB-dependent receptor [Ignavibacteriales bacterium]